MKRYRFYILLCLLFAAVTMAKAQQWKELHTGVTEELYGVCCIDTSTVFVCGQNGVILKTTDGGQTWEQKDNPAQSDLHKFEFANEMVGFACGDNVFLKTIDGGETWNELKSDTIVFFDYYNAPFLSKTNLFLVDADTLYVMDCFNTLWKSTDGGDTFEMLLDLQSYLGAYWQFDMYFEDNIGYLIGYIDWGWAWEIGLDLFAFKTQDYGRTWDAIELPDCECKVSATHFIDKDHIKLFGIFNDHSILETSDGFESYSLSTTAYGYFNNPIYLGRDVTFTSENNGCLVDYVAWDKKPLSLDFCSYAEITQDGGETWTSAPDGINWRNYLNAVDGVDTVFYIAASHGYVYKTGIADVIYPYGVDESISEISVFPNPASEMIHINGIEVAELNIYNTVGQLVKTARSCNEINVSDLPKGIYMLQVKDACGNRHWAKVAVK